MTDVKRNWGDVDEHNDRDVGNAEDNENNNNNNNNNVVQREEIAQKDGTFLVIERYQDPNGEIVQQKKIIRKEKKTKRVKKGVLERRKWIKFGDCKGEPAGPEMSITMLSNEVFELDLSGRIKEEKKNKGPVVTCPNCGETGHYRFRCPYRTGTGATGASAAGSFSNIVKQPAPAVRPAVATGGKGEGTNSNNNNNNSNNNNNQQGGKAGKYVPPGGRPGANNSNNDDSCTLRVTNISDSTTESDLAELFSPFGYVNRIFLARDHQTHKSRGFAFVTYTNKTHAEEAAAALNGHGYDSLILHVEQAKPREDKKD